MIHHRQRTLVLGDSLALIAAFAVMTALRFDVQNDYTLIVLQAKIFAGLFVLWIVLFFIFDLYSIRRSNANPRTIGLLSLAVATATLLSVALFYLFPNSLGIAPKRNLAIVAISSIVFLIIWRRWAQRFFATTARYDIVVVGIQATTQQLIADITQNSALGTIVATYIQNSDVVLPGSSTVDTAITDNVKGHNGQMAHYGQKQSDQQEIGKQIQQQALISNQGMPQQKAQKPCLIITEDAELSPLVTLQEHTARHYELLTIQQAYEVLFDKIPPELLSDADALALLGQATAGGFSALTRMIEIVFALTILIITSPVLLIAIIAIYIEDRGPVLYQQQRTGRYGVPFAIYKLRTMRQDAERHGAQWAYKHDNRITVVGAFLRKTHIDEILQMINILKGDLALIGPRPERPEFVAELRTSIPHYDLRHAVRPGFTGWAQIKFHYARTTDESREKLAYDLYYIKHRQPLLDIGIVLKTVQIIFTH